MHLLVLRLQQFCKRRQNDANTDLKKLNLKMPKNHVQSHLTKYKEAPREEDKLQTGRKYLQTNTFNKRLEYLKNTQNLIVKKKSEHGPKLLGRTFGWGGQGHHQMLVRLQ